MLLCVLHLYVQKNLLTLLGGLNYFICLAIEKTCEHPLHCSTGLAPPGTVGQAKQPARIWESSDWQMSFSITKVFLLWHARSHISSLVLQTLLSQVRENHKKVLDILDFLLYSLIFHCISLCSQGRLCDHNLTVTIPKYLLHGRCGLVVVTGKESLNNGARVLPHHTFSPFNNNNNNNNFNGAEVLPYRLFPPFKNNNNLRITTKEIERDWDYD